MKILMVCLGNICRSPLAEGLLRHKAQQAGLNLTVDSAGTSNYHLGQCPDKRTIDNAKSHGIDLSSLCARQFSVKDFDEFDKIFVMDASNMNNVLSLARNDADRQKVDLFLNHLYPGENRSVPDPWFGGDEGFEEVYQLLEKAADKCVEELKLILKGN